MNPDIINHHIDLLINDTHEIEKWREDNSYEPQFKLSEMELLREKLKEEQGPAYPFNPAEEVERLRKAGKLPSVRGTALNNSKNHQL